MMRLIILFLVCAALSCKKSGKVPSYLYIESFDISSDIVTGSNSSNIADVWVYINDNPQGVYELPATFPVISEGAVKVGLIPGIKMNGIATTRVSYPFYSEFSIQKELTPQLTDTIYPSAQYIASTKVALLEDFETGNIFNNIIRISEPSLVFEGQGSGSIAIENETDNQLAYTTTRFTIPGLTPAAFIELDYKNNHEINVGLRAYRTASAQVINIEKLNLTVKEEWNKIYINFTPEINRLQADEYELTFTFVRKSNINPVNIYLDNIKVLYL